MFFFCRISWTEKIRNEWVLQSAGTDRQLLKSVKKRKITYFGHIMRKNDKFLEKEIIQGTTHRVTAQGADRKQAGWTISDSGWG